MAGLTVHTAYITSLLKGMSSLESILKKSEQHAREHNIDPDETYLSARLYDDMLPLTGQVVIATGMAKTAVSALTDGGAPVDEAGWKPLAELKTFGDMYGRIDKAKEILEALDVEEVNGKVDEVCEFTFGKVSKSGTPAELFGIIQPNFLFHVVTAYDILRSKGVPLGKIDFLGAFM